MSKYTPGPWRVTGTHPRHIHIGADTSPMVLASMNNVHVDTPANARLIAAAPELLEALRSIVQDYEFCEQNSVFGDRVHEYVKTARAAIAKAECRS